MPTHETRTHETRTHDAAGDQTLHIDCDTCTVRGASCAECMVTVLLGLPAPSRAQPRAARFHGVQADGSPLPDQLTDDDAAALAVLTRAELVPHLRFAEAGAGGAQRARHAG